MCFPRQCSIPDLAAARENVLGIRRPFLRMFRCRRPRAPGSGILLPVPQRAAPVGALLGRARLRTVDSARDSAQHVTASPARAVGVEYWVTDMQSRLGRSLPSRYPTGTVT